MCSSVDFPTAPNGQDILRFPMDALPWLRRSLLTSHIPQVAAALNGVRKAGPCLADSVDRAGDSVVMHLDLSNDLLIFKYIEDTAGMCEESCGPAADRPSQVEDGPQD